MKRDFSRLDRYLDLLLPHVYERMETVNHRMAPDHIELATEAHRWMEGFGLEYHDVLDVGCADGYMVEFFNRSGKRAVGVTISPVEVGLCQQRGVDVLHCDMSFLPLDPHQFDLVWCRDALEHSVMPLITLFEFNRVLRPGKYALIVVPPPGEWTAASNHYSVLDDSGWRWLYKLAGFAVVGSQRSDRNWGELRYLLKKRREILQEGG